MNDLSQTIAPRSDQLNADDLIGGPRTIMVRQVSINKASEQPASIFFEGDENKPYKPGLSMRRVLVKAWGNDTSRYVGRRMTLYRDDKVRFGGVDVGGIRISHMSDIREALTMALTDKKGSRKPFTVKPLAEERAPPSVRTREVSPPAGEQQTGQRQPSNRERLYAAAKAEAARGSDALRAFRAGLDERADRALDEITADLERIAAGADVAADDGFPGFAPVEGEIA